MRKEGLEQLPKVGEGERKEESARTGYSCTGLPGTFYARYGLVATRL